MILVSWSARDTRTRHASGMAGGTYRLIVDGVLSDSVKPAFRGMTLQRQAETTVLVGPVRDQAELQGLLQRISDLGLTLLSVAAIDPATGIPSE